MQRKMCLVEAFGGMQDSDMSKTYSQGNYADGLSGAAQAEQPNSSPAIPPSAEVHTGKAAGSLNPSSFNTCDAQCTSCFTQKADMPKCSKQLPSG